MTLVADSTPKLPGSEKLCRLSRGFSAPALSLVCCRTSAPVSFTRTTLCRSVPVETLKGRRSGSVPIITQCSNTWLEECYAGVDAPTVPEHIVTQGRRKLASAGSTQLDAAPPIKPRGFTSYQQCFMIGCL